MRDDDVYTLPPGLPAPEDDGAAAHLRGMRLPSIALPMAQGGSLDLAGLGAEGRAVLYVYPRTGRPDEPSPPGWSEIPGARGCTPQSCAFRDHHGELRALRAEVFGLSAQTRQEQLEFARRVHLPFALISDAQLVLAHALRLPTFEVAGMRLYKRLTLIVARGLVEHVFYPVFPPDRNAEQVARWLELHPAG